MKVRTRLGMHMMAFLLCAGLALAEEGRREVPFERTEDREDCQSYEENKQPFFGVTHLHTGLSFDASLRFVPSRPRDAYAFAKGEAPLPGVNAHGLEDPKMYENDRPIDWGAVTDHSEYFGEMGICRGEDETAPGYNSLECQLLRGFYYRPATKEQSGTHLPSAVQRNNAKAAFGIVVWPNLGPSSLNTRLPLCTSGEGDCEDSELTIWQEMQQAAEDAYDRTSECKFTSFVGYEVSSTPSGTNWHRNVIFRNADVIERPITAIDMARVHNLKPNEDPPQWLGAPDPEHLWDGLKKECLEADNKCDALTIPHNSNLGGGVYSTSTKDGETKTTMIVPPLFFDPTSKEEAIKRQFWEPLVEIYQDKGSSECRWDPRLQAGVDTTDEHCAFELLDSNSLLSASGVGTSTGAAAQPPPLSEFPPRSWVRNVLKDGLKFQQDEEIGVNPFKLGIVASSDSHDGTMGWHPEDESFHGHLGIEDYDPTHSSSTIQNSSGGHSVVWAEENSRDAIFNGLRNKETYGTSGTRPIVRFFGGWDFDKNLCDDDFVSVGYSDGVPMGGDLPAITGDTPSFVVAAWMDDYIGTPIHEVQIIKGWVDAKGDTHEKVHTVAYGDPNAGVDSSCNPVGQGFNSVCRVWQDPEFEKNEAAFYYVRVLENPVCRYSTHICQKQFDINPLDTDCANQLLALRDKDSAAADKAAYCCSNETTVPILQPTIQERAWTSPIWYTPSGK